MKVSVGHKGKRPEIRTLIMILKGWAYQVGRVLRKSLAMLDKQRCQALVFVAITNG